MLVDGLLMAVYHKWFPCYKGMISNLAWTSSIWKLNVGKSNLDFGIEWTRCTDWFAGICFSENVQVSKSCLSMCLRLMSCTPNGLIIYEGCSFKFVPQTCMLSKYNWYGVERPWQNKYCLRNLKSQRLNGSDKTGNQRKRKQYIIAPHSSQRGVAYKAL